MKKKVTKEEVELALSNYKGWFVSTKKDEILNELFPPALEDDRVASDVGNNWEITDGAKVFKTLNGHYFKTNEDGTEVTLHKRESLTPQNELLKNNE